MAINFPTSLDDGTTLPNPTGTSTLASPDHAGLHDNENSALIALETKLGTGSSTPSGSNLLISTGTGTSAWTKAAPTGTIVGTSDTQTLTNKTLTSPTINGATIANPTLTVDTVSGYTTANSGSIYGVNITNGSIVAASFTNATLITPTITSPTIEAWDGWIAGSGTWTYASATTITVPAADAAAMQIGDRVKLTQTTAKYFYVIGISGTTITVTGGSDYSVANATITGPYYSHMATPVGFPQWFSWSPTWGNLSVGNGTLTAKFSITGRLTNVVLNLNFGSTSSVTGFINLTLPVNFSSDYVAANTPIVGMGGCVATSGYFLFSRIKSGTSNTVELVAISSATADAQAGTSATVPGTWNTSSNLNMAIAYEI